MCTAKRIVKTIFPILVIIVFIFAPILHSQAFVIAGWYWEDPSIDFYTLSGTSSATTNAWVNSANIWSVQTTSKVNFTRVYREPENGSVLGEVYVNDFWDGIALISADANGRVIRAESYLNTFYTGSYSVSKRVSVASHELGHILGLGDEGNTKQEVMNGNTYYRYDLYNISTPQQPDLYAIDNVIYRDISR